MSAQSSEGDLSQETGQLNIGIMEFMDREINHAREMFDAELRSMREANELATRNAIADQIHRAQQEFVKQKDHKDEMSRVQIDLREIRDTQKISEGKASQADLNKTSLHAALGLTLGGIGILLTVITMIINALGR